MLYKNGGWTWVIIDEWIAVEQDAQGSTWPQYAQPGTEPELWPMLLEKAYAKVHFCWDSIDGGWARCALEDLTGGNAYTLDLAKKHRSTFGTTPERLQVSLRSKEGLEEKRVEEGAFRASLSTSTPQPYGVGGCANAQGIRHPVAQHWGP